MIANCSSKSDTLAQRFQNKRYKDVTQGNRVFTENKQSMKDQISGSCTCCSNKGSFDVKHVRI